jgi:hypothetical protein
LISGEAIDGADVLIHRVDSNSAYDGLCKNKYTYQPELQAITRNQGRAGIKVFFGPDIADN